MENTDKERASAEDYKNVYDAIDFTGGKPPMIYRITISCLVMAGLTVSLVFALQGLGLAITTFAIIGLWTLIIAICRKLERQ